MVLSPVRPNCGQKTATAAQKSEFFYVGLVNAVPPAPTFLCGLLAVNLASVSYLHDFDHYVQIADFVKNPVIPLPDSIAFLG